MNRINSSFRDPDGYMFKSNGIFYRAVNLSYKSAYDHLLSSGLYQKLVDRALIVPFEEIDPLTFGLTNLYKVIKPEQISFISYPYEWAFNMLKDAAFLTLQIQELALEYGMSLKDASAYNIQFQSGKPIFIDSLSFEFHSANLPWVAYRQFCQHFIVPLALMTYVDPGLNRMFIIYIDGIPLNIATKILPFRSRLNIGIYLHIFLHAKAQKKHENSIFTFSSEKRKFTIRSMKILLKGLKSTLEDLHWKPTGTEWADYASEEVHKQDYIEFKKKVVSKWLDTVNPRTIWDLGSNIGLFSRIASKKGIDVISCDIDPACVKKNYLLVKKNNESNILPLLIDLLNTSPSIGWGGVERFSFFNRNKPDLIMALAIIHHLAICSNIPLEFIASHFACLANSLIIEFVPKEDEKVKFLLKNRIDIFPNYNQTQFEIEFTKFFNINEKITSDFNLRVFYLMTKK